MHSRRPRPARAPLRRPRRRRPPDVALVAVFGSRNRFLGMITESGSGAYSYAFVRSD